MQDIVEAVAALPLGTFYGIAFGRRYVVTRSRIAGGRGEKLVANALDGSDYISLNLYHLTAGPLLKPCEMPTEKVVAFIHELQVEPARI